MSNRNIYKKETLVGNWYEDRAPELKGVMADYGETSYETSNKTDYSTKQSEREGVAKKRTLFTKEYVSARHHKGVIPKDEWTEKTSEAVPVTKKKEWTTNYSQAYSSSDRNISSIDRTRPAGAPSVKPEKPQRRADACGERVRYDEDPQNNTAAQRSWIPGVDASSFSKNPPKAREDAAYMSLDLGRSHNSSNSTSPSYRKTTSITRNTGNGVWRDVEPSK
jgi:hypothetical protein